MKTEFRMQEKLGWGKLATFLPNKRLPVYNWFYYKEGFSRDLVMELLRMFGPLRKDWVLDPFCGAGTTMLACQESGVNSVGFDANPVSVFASRVKNRTYIREKIENEVSRILGEKYARPRARACARQSMPTGVSVKQSIIMRAFPPRLLEQVAFFRSEILRTPDHEIKDLLMLALMNVSIKSSYLWKDGAVLKIRKKPVPPIRDMFRRQVKRMLRDLEGFEREESKVIAEFGDARSLRLEDGSVRAVITSPPYLNKIEYTRIYGIEQELFLRHVMQAPPVRTFIGLTLEKLEKSSAMLAETLDQETVNGLPQESCPYFTDMTQAIGELWRVCKPGARVGLIVGNACFPDRVVDSDVILCRLAETAGFKVDKIVVLNKRWCTRNRTEKIGQLRESLLLWRKD